MEPMTNVQRKKIVQGRKDHPEKPIDDLIEHAKTGSRVIQIIATVTQNTHRAIQDVANEDNVTQDDAAVILIEEALSGRGYLD